MGAKRTFATWFMIFVAVCCFVIASATSASFFVKTDERRLIDALNIKVEALKKQLSDYEKTAPAYKYLDDNGYIKIAPRFKKVVQ